MTDSSNCSIQMLPEVDVGVSVICWCEGGRLPHKTIYRHQYTI
jgi:hypothetical protein